MALAIAAGVGAFYALDLIPVDATLYNRDFGQEYLLARAIRDGIDPYQPINVLAERYVQPIGYLSKAHPTPHPPTVGLLALPLGLLGYEVAVRVWFGLEMLCLILTIFLLVGAQIGWLSRLRFAPIVALALVTWPPITLELGLAQLMLPLLLGLAGSQVALLRGRSVLGGALLGATLVIKPIAWPWLIVLAYRRAWRALLATAAMVMVAGILSVVAIGRESTLNYLFVVLPQMSTAFFAEQTNMSPWTIPQRLGLGIPTLSLAALVLVAGSWMACRLRSLGDALGIMTITGMLASPILWYFYLTLAVLPLAQLLRSVQRRRFRPLDMAAAACVVGLLSVSQARLVELADRGAGNGVLMEPAVGLALLGILLASLTPTPRWEHLSTSAELCRPGQSGYQ